MHGSPHTLLVLKGNNLKFTEELVVYYISLSVLCTFEIFPNNKYINSYDIFDRIMIWCSSL